MSRLLCLVPLVFFSPLPLFSNFILPDFFAGFLPLLSALVFVNLGGQDRIVSLIFWVLAVMVHYSNLLLGVVSGLIVVFAKSFDTKRRKLILVLMLVVPWLLTPIVHYGLSQKFTVTDAAQIYLYSRLSSHRISHKFLDENCLKKNYALCADRDKWLGMWKWGLNTQIYKFGGLRNMAPAIAEVNRDIVFSAHLFSFLMKSAENVLVQLSNFFRPITPTLNDSSLSSELRLYSREVERKYKSHRLVSNWVYKNYKVLSWVYFFSTALSLMFLSFMSLSKRLSPRIQLVFYCSVGLYIANAIICGSLTEPSDRYSARMVWVFLWLAVLQIAAIQESEQKRLL